MGFRTGARGRLWGVALAAALSTSLTSSLGGPAAGADGAEPGDVQGWAAPDWTYSPDEQIPDGDIDARATGEAVSRAEAERRLRADRAAADLQEVARSRWPSTFAGLWIDHDPYRVKVAFTRDAAANVAELRGGFPYPDDLVAIDARYSFDVLSALQGKLASERGALQQGRDVEGMPAEIRGTRGAYDLDIDVPAGLVVVRAARPTPALRAAFARRYAGPVVVRGGLATPRTCTQADCRHAMLGGLRLEIGYHGTGGYCSSAFPAYYTADPSIRYVLSAGHCYESTSIRERYNGDELYGSTTHSRVANEVDVERDRRDGGTAFRESSKFLVQGETYPRMVSTVTTYASMAVGAYLGKTGYTTGTTRGYITSKTVAPSYVANGRNFVAADMCSDGGDSGSAVWSGNSAYGILSGGPLGQCRNINGTLVTPSSGSAGPTYFGALSYAASAMAVTVLTGVNLPPTADFAFSCLLLSCSFDASQSKDHDGEITSYAWNFGDGGTGTGRTTTHSYALPGLYTVTLTTKDNNGATTSKSVGIAVTAS